MIALIFIGAFLRSQRHLLANLENHRLDPPHRRDREVISYRQLLENSRAKYPGCPLSRGPGAISKISKDPRDDVQRKHQAGNGCDPGSNYAETNNCPRLIEPGAQPSNPTTRIEQCKVCTDIGASDRDDRRT